MEYGDVLYGVLQYSQEVPNDDEIKQYKPDLMSYLPKYYEVSRVMNSLQEVNSTELGLLKFYIEDLLNQFFVVTATWGLVLWESFLGIPTDLMQSLESRREIIIAKIRGAGTTTKEMLKNVAEAFSGGEVNIIEYPAEYRFVVQFIGIKGIPPNMSGLTQTIENIKPAHLVYNYQYTFTWWNILKELTWLQAGAKTWNELRVYE